MASYSVLKSTACSVNHHKCHQNRLPTQPGCVQASRTRVMRHFITRATEEDADILQPSRHMALPNNALWLLDYLQDKFYDVRGSNFVIQRCESEAPGRARKQRRPTQLVKLGDEQTAQERQLSMIQRVVHHYPGSVMLLEGATVDISDYIEPCMSDSEDEPSVITANTTCTGIVSVPQVMDDNAEDDDTAEQDTYYTNSQSPRRTKMVGFTCKVCGARNYNSVNPLSFHEGTLVAQCAGCQRWHKLADHLGLFHHLQGPLFRKKGVVTEEDVPPSLRLLDPEDFPDYHQ